MLQRQRAALIRVPIDASELGFVGISILTSTGPRAISAARQHVKACERRAVSVSAATTGRSASFVSCAVAASGTVIFSFV